MDFKTLSLNTRGFTQPFRDYLFHNLLFDADIFCFQDVQISDPSFFKSFAEKWRGSCFWSPALGKQGGVMTCFSDSFDYEVVQWKRDTSGRVVSVVIKVNDYSFNIVNIYAPTNLTERKVFFENLHEYFLPSDSIVIAGDFNCYEYQSDKTGGNLSCAKYLADFRSTFNLVDAWQRLNPHSRQCNWFNSDFSIGSRLDKFLVSQSLFSFISNCEIKPFCLSDHDIVYLTLRLDDLRPRGPGLWKFNNSLLQDTNFIEYISDRMNALIEGIEHFPSVKLWWDFFKNSLQAEIIAFSRTKRKNLSHERVVLTNEIIRLKALLVSGDFSVSPVIRDLENKLKDLVLKELSGATIRSKARWLEEGEKPSRFFFKLERERIQRNSISSVLNSDDVEVFSHTEIEHEIVQFYSHLFSSETIDPLCKQTCFASIENHLDFTQQQSCEGFLSLQELSDAVKTLNLGKSPGSDGFSVEFYLFFWDILGPLLLRVANQCFRDGNLCDSMKGSVTRLIYKKRGDIKNLKNWRPISLLNVDYKIISKVLTLRLSKVLEFIVSPDQTCSVPGRSILSNVTLLRDIIDSIQETDECAVLVSLDQEKAFDRVDRTFLSQLLEVYGFGPDFCRWLTTLYDDAFMQVIINDRLSSKVCLQRGVRQGDPLSPLLYVICVEVLASLIRRSPEIEGFLLPGASGLQARARLYADDVFAVLKNLKSLEALLSLIELYEKGTGAKLNKSKTEAMWLGAWRFRADEPLGLTWVKKMKVLGVFFGTIPVEQDNWMPKINKLEKALNLWRSRSLSLLGKALIINVLGFSKLLYLAKVLLVPPWVFARINSIVWPFLWGCKMETVSRNTCYLKVKNGGINLVNLKLKCQALRVAGMISTLNNLIDSSFYLCRFYVGRRLSTLRSEWRSLASNLIPNAVLPSNFYSDCISVLSSVRLPDDNLNSKVFYNLLLSKESSSPLLSWHWTPVLGPGFSLSGHWSRVRDDFCENFKEDILWLIVLRGIKVRDSLTRWGYIANPQCSFCGRRETIDHCFLYCSRVKFVWSHFFPLLSQILGREFALTPPVVFFFCWPSISAKRSAIARYIIKTIIYGLWFFRNKSTFRNIRDNHRAIIRFVSFDISSRIRLDFVRLTYSRFPDRCSFPPFICVNDGLVSINI